MRGWGGQQPHLRDEEGRNWEAGLMPPFHAQLHHPPAPVKFSGFKVAP